MKYWLWLSRIEGLGPIKIKDLLQKFKTPQNIWNATKEQLQQINGIGEKLSNIILNSIYKQNLEQYETYMKKHNIGIITFLDTIYPQALKNIYDPPIILYYKGNKALLEKENILAMIGCRECSEYGKKISFRFAYELAKRNITIISGMAKGIDSFSHLGCIKANGTTIAVLGNGLDQIYPIQNVELYNEILENQGLILSEYIIGTKPTKLNFPARNRIISGLSKGVLVIEAKKKSGTLNTVDFALEQGRDVFAVPRQYTKR